MLSNIFKNSERKSKKRSKLGETNTKNSVVDGVLKERSDTFESTLDSTLSSYKRWKHVEKQLKNDFNWGNDNKWVSMRCPILHLILKYNPPIHIVMQIVKNNPMSVFEIDCKNYSPIHTALSCGTSSVVLDYLISCNKEAVLNVVEPDRKTPMHLAVDGYEILSIDPMSKLTSFETFSETIKILYKIQPSFIAKKDANKMDVVKYAINNMADNKVISKLRTLRGEYKESRKIEKEIENINQYNKSRFSFEVLKKQVSNKSLSSSTWASSQG